jgi:hypothetical protein
MWIEGTVDSQGTGTSQGSSVSGTPKDLPSASQLGELAKQWAPDMPPEVVNAVFNVESRHGTNPASWTSRDVGKGRTVIGPGQIQDSAYSWQAGNPKSLAEAYFPSDKLGVPYQKGNLQHVTIASLAFMNEKWTKAKGDIQVFADGYHGKGTSNNGETNISYAAKLRDAANGMGKNAINFFAGRGQSEQQVADLIGRTGTLENLAAKQGEMRKINEQEKAVLASDNANLVSKLLNLGDAGKNIIVAASQESLDKARQTKDFMTRALGFDVTADSTNLTAAGKALDKNLGDLLNLKEGLDKNRSNPIYAILDGMSGGKVSKQFTDNIKQLETESASIGNAMAQIHKAADSAAKIGMATIAGMSEAETRAKLELNTAETDYKVALTKGQTNIKLVELDRKTETAINAIENASTRLGFQQQSLQITAANADLNNKIKLLNEERKAEADPLKQQILEERVAAVEAARETARVKQLEQVKLAKAFENAGTATGQSPKVIEAAYKAKDKATMELVALTNSDAPSLGLLKVMDSKGTLPPADKTALRAAVGLGGWANPTTNKLAAKVEMDVLTEAAKLKAVATPSERVSRELLMDGQRSYEIGLLQNRIVNNADTKQDEKNPYAAPHLLILSNNKTLLAPALMNDKEAQEIYARVSKSKLLNNLQGLTANGTKEIGDKDVANQVATMLASKSGTEYSVAQAAQEGSDYFKLAIKLNNSAKNYTAAGFKEQTDYGVPLTVMTPSLVFTPDNLRSLSGFAIGIPAVGPSLSVAAAKLAEQPAAGIDVSAKPKAKEQVVNLANEEAFKRLVLTLAIKQRN